MSAEYKQEASREEKCPTCGNLTSYPRCGGTNFLPRFERNTTNGQIDGCTDPWHKGSATVQTPDWMTNGIPEDEEYIGFARWAGPTTSRYLALCDSDSLGAFKIFRRNIR